MFVLVYKVLGVSSIQLGNFWQVFVAFLLLYKVLSVGRTQLRIFVMIFDIAFIFSSLSPSERAAHNLVVGGSCGGSGLFGPFPSHQALFFPKCVYCLWMIPYLVSFYWKSEAFRHYCYHWDRNHFHLENSTIQDGANFEENRPRQPRRNRNKFDLQSLQTDVLVVA